MIMLMQGGGAQGDAMPPHLEHCEAAAERHAASAQASQLPVAQVRPARPPLPGIKYAALYMLRQCNAVIRQCPHMACMLAEESLTPPHHMHRQLFRPRTSRAACARRHRWRAACSSCRRLRRLRLLLVRMLQPSGALCSRQRLMWTRSGKYLPSHMRNVRWLAHCELSHSFGSQPQMEV